jgi:mannosyltransferase
LSPRRYVYAVVVITAIGAAIRFATLGRQSYWFDELFTVSLVRGSFGHMLFRIPRTEATPYLYYLIAWPWSRVFGLHEAGLRSFSALCGTATIPVTYGAGAALASRRVGVIAAALVSVSPFLVWYSQEARAYALLTLLAALTLLFFGRALRGSRWMLAGWALSCALALATHYFAAFLVAPEAALLLIYARPRRLVALAALLPTAVQCYEISLILKQRGNGNSATQSPLASRAAGVPKDLLVGYSFPLELAGTIVAALLVLVAFALLATRANERLRRAALLAGTLAVASLVLPLVFALGGIDFLIARNVIGVAVPAAVCVAAGFAVNRAGASAATALCALLVAVTLTVSVDARYERTDWRGAARALGPTTVERAIVVAPPMSGFLWRPYLPDGSVFHLSTLRVGEIDVVGLATQGAFSSGPLAPPRPNDSRPPPGFRRVETRQTTTFSLVRYRAASPRLVTLNELYAVSYGTRLPANVVIQHPPR